MKKMMKKTLGITALVLLIFAGWVLLYYAVCGGWGNVKNAQILEWESAIYSDDDIEAAFQTLKKEFWNYTGCTLTELYYAGDDRADEFNEIAGRRKYDEAIIILSTIETGSSGEESGFSPNSTYAGWQFILARNAGGGWKVVDAGY